MPPDALAADTGTLGLDDAAALMVAADEKQEQAPAVAETTPAAENSEAAPTAEAGDAPEGASEVETEEGAEPVAETLPAIEPPKFWDAAAKDRFRELPRDVQEVISANEQLGVKATAKSLEEAATARKAAEAEASRLTQYTSLLDKLIPQAQATFKSRWEDVDWAKVAAERGADETLSLRFQMERENVQLQQLESAKAVAVEHENLQFRIARLAQFKDLVPDFVDEKLGSQRQQEVVTYLTAQGIAPDVIVNRASAAELAIAYKAMRWDQAQAKAKAAVSAPAAPKPAAPAARPTVRPTAATGGSTPTNPRLGHLRRQRKLSLDEGAELMTLEENQP